MLQIQRIRQEPEAIIEGLKKRGIDASETVHTLTDLDAKRRAIRHEIEENQRRLNGLSKDIGELFKSGRAHEANALKEETGTIKEAIKDLGERVQSITGEEHDLLLSLPNVPHASVKSGRDEKDN